MQLADKASRATNWSCRPSLEVGITRCEQHEEGTFTLYFSDGSTKSSLFPHPGMVNLACREQLVNVASEGAAGRRGQPGSPGKDGRNGLDGLPGASVDTAAINSAGELLLGLTNGKSIKVGRVIGPAGQTGERGGPGLPGKPGVDGNKILSGVKAPDSAEGNDGDFYIYTADPYVPLYKKINGAWQKQCELGAPASAGKGGGPGKAQLLSDTRSLPLHNNLLLLRRVTSTQVALCGTSIATLLTVARYV